MSDYIIGVDPAGDPELDATVIARVPGTYPMYSVYATITAPVGEASPSGGQAGAPVRAPAVLLETGPPCHLCRGRNMLRAGSRVYFCQRCLAATGLTLSAEGWRSYGATLSAQERAVVLERMDRRCR